VKDLLLEQLAQLEVPAPPPQFDRQLHARLNRTLVVQHLADLALRIMPGAMTEMAKAAFALAVYSLAGRFDLRVAEKRKKEM